MQGRDAAAAGVGEKRGGGIMSSEKLFHEIRGVIPQHTVTVGDNYNVTSDTPFVAIGMYVDPANGVSNKAVFLCAVQGGKIMQIRASDLRINFSDEMKKALAEVVLTS